MNEWISVKDRLPESDDDVLVYNFKDGITIGSFHSQEVSGYYEEDGSYFVTDCGWYTKYSWAPSMSPTHWRPLPPIPD
jgi:hypothetical protein